MFIANVIWEISRKTHYTINMLYVRQIKYKNEKKKKNTAELNVWSTRLEIRRIVLEML